MSAIYICDRCKAQTMTLVISFPQADVMVGYKQAIRDLCEACVKELNEWIKPCDSPRR